MRRSEGQEVNARVVTSFAAALEAKPSLAVICTPTALHHESALPFIEARIPILLEKPVTADHSSACALAEVARHHNVIDRIGVAYCLRYHPAYRMAWDLVQGGRLGRLLHAHAWFESYLPEWHPSEDYRKSYAARSDLGGGVLPTLDHELDFLHWIGGYPTAVDGRLIKTGARSTSFWRSTIPRA